MKNGICPKCNSHDIIKNKPIPAMARYNTMNYLSLFITGKRTSWISRRIAVGKIRAWVCGECGYTELYTTNYKDLLMAEIESKTSRKK